MEKVTLGSYLRTKREANKRTLVDMLKNVDVSKMYLSQIERDEKIPSDIILRQIANSYGVDEVTLFELANKVPIHTQEELREHKKIQRYLARAKEEQVDEDTKNRMYDEIEQVFKKYLK
ncbi:helix-turn-helix domain-containing protein [Solibacillus silvestris]